MTAAPDRVTPRAYVTLGILVLLNIVSFLDRQVISLLVDPIKAELGIDDFQLSMLQGLAFAIFYGLCSIPLGWAVDRFSRRWIIYLGVTGWSIATLGCGLARNFGQMFVARMGVGVGEAALSPAAYSMLPDLFPPRRLNMATGVLATGAAIGTGVALAVGGMIVIWSQQAGAIVLPVIGTVSAWRLVFLIAGAVGVVLAFLIFLAPATHRHAPAVAQATEVDPGYGRWLRDHAAYLGTLSSAAALWGAFAYGLAAWEPALLSRVFGLPTGEIGITLGMIQLVTGVVGYVFGGWLIDRMMEAGISDPHYRYLIYGGFIVVAAGAIGILFASSAFMAYLMIGILHLVMPFTASYVGHLQMSVPARYRGRTIALVMLIMTVTATTIGPMTVAFFTDYVFGAPEMVGHSIAATAALFVPASILLLVIGLPASRRAAAESEIL